MSQSRPTVRFSVALLLAALPLALPGLSVSAFAGRAELEPANTHTDPLVAAATSSRATRFGPSWAPQLETIGPNNLERLAPLSKLQGHSGDVNQVTFSPDGSLLASASDDGTIIIWDVASGSALRTLRGHTAAVAAVAFSSDGEMLASGGYDRTARLWQVEDGSLLQTVESPFLGYVLAVEFVPDSNQFVMADHLCDTQVRQAPSGILRQTLHQPHCTTTEVTVRAWSLEFSPDGNSLVTGEGTFGSGGSLHRWDIRDPFQPPYLIEGYNASIRAISFSPDGNTLAVALLGSPVFWLLDAEEGDLLALRQGHIYRVNSLDFSPNGELLVSAGRDRRLNLWVGDETEPRRVLVEHTDEINSAEFSPKGELLASGGSDDLVILWGIR